MTRGPAVEAVCIVGPTASGKSSLAARIACTLGTDIVSIDAMQVYRGMDIGTAKASAEELGCPQHMVDIVDPDEPYSVARFQHDARQAIDGILQRGMPAVLCGGTGLYLDAVIDEMSFPHGELGGTTRRRYEELAEREGALALHQLLRSRDPASAALIEPANVRRVVRALEMLDEGHSYAVQHEGLRRREPHYRSRIWAIALRRDRLYARIERRVDEMFERGLVDEVAGLRERGLVRDSTAGQAIGFKEVLAALDGDCSLDEARDEIKKRTRRYAKRQLSWLRRDGRCHWLDYDEISEEDACAQVLQALGEGSVSE